MGTPTGLFHHRASLAWEWEETRFRGALAEACVTAARRLMLPWLRLAMARAKRAGAVAIAAAALALVAAANGGNSSAGDGMGSLPFTALGRPTSEAAALAAAGATAVRRLIRATYGDGGPRFPLTGAPSP